MWHGIATKTNKQKCGFWTCRTVSRCGTLGPNGLSTTGPQEKLAWAIPTHSPSLGFSPAWMVRFRQHISAPCPPRAVLLRASQCNWGPSVLRNTLNILQIWKRNFIQVVQFRGSVGKNLRLPQKCNDLTKTEGQVGLLKRISVYF